MSRPPPDEAWRPRDILRGASKPTLSRALRLLASALLTVAIGGAAGCPRPTDGTPQIEVSPFAAARIGLIPSRGGASAERPGRARVHPMAVGEELGGPNATGRAGDWVLENDEVTFVIDALGREAGFAESGGNLIDAADARARKDELGQLFTYFGAFPRQGVYRSIDARVEPDGTAVVESRGAELYEPSIDVVTQYRLAPSDRALLLRTTLVNRGAARVTGLGLGDAVQWGGAEKVAPGKSVGFKGPSSGPYVAGIGRFVSYAITSTEGEIAAQSGGAWTDTEQKKDVALEPGATVTYERVFLVGERPDVASIVAELTKATPDGEVGALEIVLTDASGAPVAVPAGAKVVVGTDAAPEILSIVATKDGTTFGGELPPGKWLVGYAPSAGRRGDGKRAAAVVKKGGVTRVSLAVTEPASVSLGPCEEAPRVPPAVPSSKQGERVKPIPCKLTVEGLSGASDPSFGPAHVAGLAKNVVTLRPSETISVPLPRGRYRVTASRGPEYDLHSVELDVPSAAPPPPFNAGRPSPAPLGPPWTPSSQAGLRPLRFALRRVVDTADYVASDFHQHTILSADAPVGTRDRVLANAAEGLEVAVASEHNTIADLTPVVKELGLSAYHVAIAGVELTSDASKTPFGHANVFPLVPQPGRARNGAPAVRDRLAADVFADARAMPGGPKVVQINHPRAKKNGYFDQLGFDPSTGVGNGSGYDASFDAIEVWNGRAVGHRTRVLEDFFALLRASRPTTPIANTDTHGIVGEEPGYPRTFVRLAHPLADSALDEWDAARSEDLVKGIRERRDVILSNGPFLRVSANGAPIGGVASPRGGSVEVKLTVVTAPWVVATRAEIRLARGPAPAVASVALASKKNADGAMVAHATFSLRPKADDALVVIVSGTKPMKPVLSSADEAEIAPWAMSGPIWIDVDGDGTSLGRTR